MEKQNTVCPRSQRLINETIAQMTLFVLLNHEFYDTLELLNICKNLDKSSSLLNILFRGFLYPLYFKDRSSYEGINSP